MLAPWLRGYAYSCFYTIYTANNRVGAADFGGTIVKVGTVDVKTGKRLTTADVIPREKRGETIAKVREAVITKIGVEKNLMP